MDLRHALSAFAIAALPALASAQCNLNENQPSNTVYMAAFSQTDLAQSFTTTATSMCGAGIYLQPSVGTTDNVTISLWTNLPNAGGIMLATASAAGTQGSWVDVFWTAVGVTPGNTYYLVFTGNSTLGISGDVANPYPNGMVFANPGYGPFPGFDYTFRTFGNGTPPPPPAPTCPLDQNQPSTASGPMAAFAQTDLAQSFQTPSSSICGAGVFLTPGWGTGDNVSIQLWTNLPNAGGIMLASGSGFGSAGTWVDIGWPTVAITPNTTYYLVFSGNTTLAIEGDTNNPYPGGQVYANPGYGSFPAFDYTFRTFSVAPSLCPLDQNQPINTAYMAHFAQTDLAQSFQTPQSGVCGAGILLQAGIGGTDNVTIELWDNLPNLGGNLLASGSNSGTQGQWVDVNWPTVGVTPNTTYYLVFTGNSTLGITGSISDTYPFGNVFANPGYGSFPSYDYTFRTYSGVTCGTPTAYCTAGTTTNGCNASISATGTPSASASSGFVVNVANVEGQKTGILFYGINNTGFTPAPWGAGTSFLCVKAPTQRMPVQFSGGTAGACDGTFSADWLAYLAGNPGALGNPFSAGDDAFIQAWFRDPPAPKTTNLSDALTWTMCP